MDPAEIQAKIRLISYNVGTTNWQAAEKLVRFGADDTKRIAAEIGAKEKTVRNVRSEVKKLGLLPGMKPVVPASPRETSLGNMSLIPPGTESLERENTSPIGKGAGDVEEIVPDAQRSQGQQIFPRDAESPRDTGSSPRDADSSPRDADSSSRDMVRDNPQPTELGKSPGTRGSPRASPGNAETSPDSLGASLGTFAEEMMELRKTMQFVREGPREDRPAVSELMDKELMLQATPIISRAVLNPQNLSLL